MLKQANNIVEYRGNCRTAQTFGFPQGRNSSEQHSSWSRHPRLSISEDAKDKSRSADINIARTVQITPDARESSPVTRPQLEANDSNLDSKVPKIIGRENAESVPHYLAQ
jgi:hypothetical protein